VLTCSALELTGIDTIWKTVLKHREVFSHSRELEQKRRQQAVAWMWSLIDEASRSASLASRTSRSSCRASCAKSRGALSTQPPPPTICFFA